MTHHVRIGIIGFGYWGPNLTRNFMELPATELVAVADLNPHRRKHVADRYPTVKNDRKVRRFF